MDLELEATAEDEDGPDPIRSDWSSDVSCFVDLVADMTMLRHHLCCMLVMMLATMSEQKCQKQAIAKSQGERFLLEAAK